VKHASFAEKITVVVSTNVVALLRETNLGIPVKMNVYSGGTPNGVPELR
jgi:hypothetical protein